MISDDEDGNYATIPDDNNEAGASPPVTSHPESQPSSSQVQQSRYAHSLGRSADQTSKDGQSVASLPRDETEQEAPRPFRHPPPVGVEELAEYIRAKERILADFKVI